MQRKKNKRKSCEIRRLTKLFAHISNTSTSDDVWICRTTMKERQRKERDTTIENKINKQYIWIDNKNNVWLRNNSIHNLNKFERKASIQLSDANDLIHTVKIINSSLTLWGFVRNFACPNALNEIHEFLRKSFKISDHKQEMPRLKYKKKMLTW